MSVRAKMLCTARNESPRHEPDGSTITAAQITLSAQYEPDPEKRSPENEIFGKATPSGSVTMYVANGKAHEQFQVGKFYYIDFTECPDQIQ